MSYAELSPDASALLAWLVARGGSALQRDFGDTAPRRFRRASVHSALVAELLEAGRIAQTCERPRTFAVAGPKPASASAAPASPSGPGAKLRAMLEDAAAELDDLPEGLASYAAAVSVRERLVARLLASNGLPTGGEHARAARAVDAAVFKAFGFEMPG